MNMFEIKKVIPVENTLNIEECERFLISDKFCLGILNNDRDIISYVLKEDIEKLLKYNIKTQPISLIATYGDITDINIADINEEILNKYTTPGLNKGIFIGSNRKQAEHLVVNNLNKENSRFLLTEFEKNIPEKVKQALKLCAETADKINKPIFLIGGVVRDIIINKEISDVDITIQDNAIEFSKLLRKEFPFVCKIKETHEDFKTAKVIFKIDNEEVELDIASTRRETYLYPASLPKIIEIGCEINCDIRRRDFTINAMALSLNSFDFCRLVDPFNGYEDLTNKYLKILHPLSFIDDPTRIIRGLKFSVRFNLENDDITKYLQEKCLNNGLFDNLGGERIKSEIKQTFNLNKPECLIRFIKENHYYLLEKNINKSVEIDKLAIKCFNTINEYKKYISSDSFIWLIYLGVIITELSNENITLLIEKMYLSGIETEILLGAKAILSKIDLIKNAVTRFDTYEQLEGYFTESILIALILSDNNEVKINVDLFLKELQNIKIFTTGKSLIDHGFTPGPTFGNILQELLQAKINREIHTQEDEINFLNKFSRD